MKKDRDLSNLFASGKSLEASLVMSGILNNDGGKHYISYKIKHSGYKQTVIDSLSVYGNVIVIVESKNYQYISGSVNEQTWCGAGRNKRKFRVLSPIEQNRHHAKILINYLKRKNIPLHSYSIVSYVVVPDTCELDICERSKAYVISENELEKIKLRLSRNIRPYEELGKVLERGLYENM